MDTKSYTKDGVKFYPCFNSVTGKKFFVAELNGYDVTGKTEEEIFRKYKRLGKIKDGNA